MKKLAITAIFPNPKQPRQNFNKAKLQELAESIREHGLLEPVIVVKRKKGYMIVCGERRIKACQIAKKKAVAVKIIKANNSKIAELALIENLQREDLTIIEEARGYKTLLDSGLSAKEISKRMGFKQTWQVTRRTGLLKLDSAYQDMLVKGHLNSLQAFEMTRLNHDQQRILFQYITTGKATTYNKVRSLTNAMLHAQEQTSFIPESNEKDLEIKSKYDLIIEKLYKLIDNSFSKDDLGILKSVLGSNLDANVEKLNLIIMYLRKIKNAISDAQSIQQAIA